MERVAFLVERTGERITCLLNPESVVMRRLAGVRSRSGATGIVTGQALTDDPLLATGGGTTEIDLDLLFDVAIARELAPTPVATAEVPTSTEIAAEIPAAVPPVETDVRELTRPLWNLAENGQGTNGYGAPPVVRFIWGRAWNVLGIVVAIAERLERFTQGGMPQRSWLRLRLRRVTETEARPAPTAPVTPQFEPPTLTAPAEGAEEAPSVELPVDPDGMPQMRHDQIAAEYFGDPLYGRLIAAYNNIDDPLSIPEGTVLRLPPLPGGTPS
jgi:hypothetical protein